MRVAFVFQWLRAAQQDPARRRACLAYAIVVSLAQIGWVALIFSHFSVAVTVILGGVLALIEVAALILTERMDGGTPWHAHHIAKRHGLFATIALGRESWVWWLRCRRPSTNKVGLWMRGSSGSRCRG
jgi:low temperature requirement protein LtrA